MGSILGLGRSPGERNGSPLQYSCLENPMDREAWWATVHGIAESQKWLSTHGKTKSSKIYNPRGSKQGETLEILSLDLSVLPGQPHSIHVTLGQYLTSLFLGLLTCKMKGVNSYVTELSSSWDKLLEKECEEFSTASDTWRSVRRLLRFSYSSCSSGPPPTR